MHAWPQNVPHPKLIELNRPCPNNNHVLSAVGISGFTLSEMPDVFYRSKNIRIKTQGFQQDN